MIFQKMQNYGDNKKTVVAQGLGEGGVNRWNTKDFFGQ